MTPKRIPTTLLETHRFAVTKMPMAVYSGPVPEIQAEMKVITLERYRTLKNPGEYDRRISTGFIVVHCADTPPDLDVDAAMIRAWHVRERGWIDIGYHFVIKRNGTIQTGRPLWAVGSGVGGFNSRSIHICLAGGRFKGQEDNHGHYLDTRAHDLYEPEQMDALKFLLANLLKHGGFQKADLRGHRDFGLSSWGKTCPNFDVRDWAGKELWPNLDMYTVPADEFNRA